MNWTKDLNVVGHLKDAGSNVTKGTIDFVPSLMLGILLLIVGAIAIRIGLSILRRSLAVGKIDPTTRSLVISAARFGAWLLLAAAVLWKLGLQEIAAAVAGIAALVALGLAQGASGVTADILAGVFLVGDPRFAVGRRVTAGGVEGVVEQITIRKSTIRTDDGTLHVVPNRAVDAAAYQIKPAGDKQQPA